LVELCDTHCHLDFHAFDEDRAETLQRARAASVTRLLDVGIDLASSAAAVQLSESHPEVYAAVGVHPSEARQWQADTPARLRELARHPKVVAIGEIGLDYYRNHAPRQMQRRVFGEQLALAAELGLPVVVHCRQASEDVLGLLAEWQSALASSGSPLAERPGVWHAFSGEEADARQAIDQHFYLGIGGPVTFLNAKGLQAVVTRLPLNCLLLETDAPFLAPHPRRGQRNEPAYVRQVAQKIAELHNLPPENVIAITTANAGRLFNWREVR